MVFSFIIIYNKDYIKFVIARAWYDWVTSYSKAPIVEVNVIQTNTQNVHDVQGSKDIPESVSNLPRGYLG